MSKEKQGPPVPPPMKGPRPPIRQLRDKRCGTCQYCEDLNVQIGQCRKYPPTAQFMANPEYTRMDRREQIMDKDARAAAEAQTQASIMFPYPWPQMMLDTDWCGAWQKRTDIQIAKVMPN